MMIIFWDGRYFGVMSRYFLFGIIRIILRRPKFFFIINILNGIDGFTRFLKWIL